MSYEIPRLTPFQSQEVWYDCRVVEEVGERLRVKLALVPLDVIDDIAHFFLDRSFRLHTARVEGDEGLNLLPPSLREPKRLRWQRHYFFVLLALLLLGLLLLVPLVLKRQHAIALNHQRFALMDAARGEDELWFTLQNLQEEIDFFAEKHNDSFTHVLNELSRLLPHNAWLINLNYNAEQGLTLYGISNGNAAGFAHILAQSPLFYNVRFSAPITQAHALYQNFQIALEVNWARGPAALQTSTQEQGL